MRRTNSRNLRNQHDYTLPIYRLESTLKSFIPSSVKLWNNLDSESRNCSSYNQFKSVLKSDVYSIPRYFLVGDRFTNIQLSRIRHMCSSLNSDLFKSNISSTPSCHCGNPFEDAFHFLLECPRYVYQRELLIEELRNYIPLTLDQLLFGDIHFDDVTNSKILLSVQKYIKATKRFN